MRQVRKPKRSANVCATKQHALVEFECPRCHQLHMELWSKQDKITSCTTPGKTEGKNFYVPRIGRGSRLVRTYAVTSNIVELKEGKRAPIMKIGSTLRRAPQSRIFAAKMAA